MTCPDHSAALPLSIIEGVSVGRMDLQSHSQSERMTSIRVQQSLFA